jgi:hypothetical protein
VKGLGIMLSLMARETARETEIIGPAQVCIGLRKDNVMVEGHTRQDHPSMRGVNRRIAEERDVVVGM